MQHHITKIFQGLALTSFGLATYNTANNIKANKIRQELLKERNRKEELEAMCDSVLKKNNEQLEYIKEQNNTIIESIKDIANSSSSNSNNYLSSYQFDNLQQFINSLNMEQTLYFMHISGSIAILLSLYSIICIFFGNTLIDYFDLETRFPKLAKFIKLRRAFQKYYLVLNIGLISIILFVIIYINFLLILNYY